MSAPYLPFLDGRYTVTARLRALGDAPHFQVDGRYGETVALKRAADRAHPGRYDRRAGLSPELERAIARFAVETLPQDAPAVFDWDGARLHNRALGLTIRPDWETLRVAEASDPFFADRPLFAALALQTQEDWAAVARDGDADTTAALHVSFPSHWRPEDKIGRSFVEVHRPVAGVAPLLRAAPSLVETMIARGPWERFTWTLPRWPDLDEHLDVVARRPIPAVPLPEAVGGSAWLRVERQVIQGFPAAGGALFMIRLHVTPLGEALAEPGAAAALAAAVRSMSPESAAYKGLTAWREPLLAYLDAL